MLELSSVYEWRERFVHDYDSVTMSRIEIAAINKRVMIPASSAALRRLVMLGPDL